MRIRDIFGSVLWGVAITVAVVAAIAGFNFWLFPDQYGYLNRFGWIAEYLITIYAMCGLFWLITKLLGLLVGYKWKDEA